jgi:predicted nucleic acid-binding protein
MKIYFDVCCLNRPFDDQTQNRIRLEAEAILLILTHIQTNDWIWVSSEVVLDEIEQTPTKKRRDRLHQLIANAHESYALTDKDVNQAKSLVKKGLTAMDALHIACAEACGVDVFLTTDDKLIRQATRLVKQINIPVENPLNWLIKQQEIK